MFIGPCIAKRVEAREHRETINYVLSFEEIMCMLEGKDIKFAEMSGDAAYERDASKLGLSFPLTAGVSAAVQDTVAAMGGEVHNAQYCSGLDKCVIRLRLLPQASSTAAISKAWPAPTAASTAPDTVATSTSRRLP